MLMNLQSSLQNIAVRILSWLVVRAGLRLLPEGCRAIPAGHFNFDPNLADQIGVTKAIIYQKVMGWIETNRSRGRNLIDGQAWSYNTYPQWAADIQIFHQKTIEKHIRELEVMGLLSSEQFDQREGNQRKYYTSPVSLSDNVEQMLLWPESLTPMTGAGLSADSSMNKLSKNNLSTPKSKTPTPTARGYEAQSVGDVAQFAIPTGELPDIQIVQPEARDTQDEHEAYAFQGNVANAGVTQNPPPVPSTPSQDDVDTQGDEACIVPAWMPEFFDGCGPDELVNLVERYGVDVLTAAKMVAETRQGVTNPAGFVRAMLAKGWRPAVNKPTSEQYTDPFDRLRGESTEYLLWVISDQCNWLEVYKSDAREILAARGVELVEAEV